jgi:hypothetical protein
MRAMHMRAVEHTIRRGFCTHHAAWVNHTENRCMRQLLALGGGDTVDQRIRDSPGEAGSRSLEPVDSG